LLCGKRKRREKKAGDGGKGEGRKIREGEETLQK